jgi:hypothetical protein
MGAPAKGSFTPVDVRDFAEAPKHIPTPTPRYAKSSAAFDLLFSSFAGRSDIHDAVWMDTSPHGASLFPVALVKCRHAVLRTMS